MSPLFPRKVCEVVHQGGEKLRYRCQFTWWCDGRSDQPTQRRDWEISKVLARTVYWGDSRDPTGGALWYHAGYVKPACCKKFERGLKIGRHVFYGLSDDWLVKALPYQESASYSPD